MTEKTLFAERPNLLIVDDEKKICDLIKTFLATTELFGHIVVADSVSLGLLKLRNEKFDMIIIDYNMPEKKGTAFVDITKKSFQHRNLKYLLISGFIDNISMMNIINSGLKHVLVKPFSRSDLIEKVCEVLEVHYPVFK